VVIVEPIHSLAWTGVIFKLVGHGERTSTKETKSFRYAEINFRRKLIHNEPGG